MLHTPVLLNEVIKFLDPRLGQFVVDGTVGGAGHSREILNRIGLTGKLLGIDLDKERIENCKLKIGNYTNVILVHGNYANLPAILKKYKLGKADGLLLDLGFSSEQLHGRGVSFSEDEPLDMRYDAKSQIPNYKSQNWQTAADIINRAGEKELTDIIWKYGEERFSRRIAGKIVEARKKKRIITTFDLAEIVKSAVPRYYERGRIHPATRTFQALRIYVNSELENLETLLKNLPQIMSEGGRAVIISFHSLEDRLVKNYFRDMAKAGKVEILTKKPVTPAAGEITKNQRSRSAKLRAAVIHNNF